MATETKNKYEKIGAAWIGQYGINGSLELNGKDGEKIRFYFFENKEKKGDKSPDYYIMRKKEDMVGGTKESPKAVAEIETQTKNDDLPF